MPEPHYDGYQDVFASSYDIALQQRTSRFSPHVTMGGAVTGDDVQVINHIMPIEAEIGATDNSATKLLNAEFAPRWASAIVVRTAVAITPTDLASMEDPSSAVVQSIMMGMQRAQDSKILLPAMYRDVTGGKDKDQTFSFPASQVVEQTVGATEGLNRVKIDDAYEKFEDAEVDLGEEDATMGISPRQHRLMRNLAEVNQEEFKKMGGQIDEKGRVKRFLGLNVVVSTRLNKVTIGGTKYVECPVWVKSGMVVTPWKEPKVRISERPDRNHITQLFVEGRWAATRTEEERVIKIICNEEVLV